MANVYFKEYKEKLAMLHEGKFKYLFVPEIASPPSLGSRMYYFEPTTDPLFTLGKRF